MSTESIKQALEERDQALEAKFAELAGENVKLSEKNLDLSLRITELEQAGGSEFHDEPPSKHAHSFGRVLKALSDPRGKVDGFEAEWSQEFVHKSGLDLPGATWLPLSTKAVDYESTSPSAGGSKLIQTELHSNEFIDILRQQSVVLGLNPRMINGTGDIDVPKQSSGATAYWVDGDGTAITESTPNYTTVQLRPKFCSGWVKYNYRVGLQTGGDIESIIRADLAAQIAAEIDNQAINGDGTGSKITGILNTSGINSTTWGSSPATLLWADVLELEKMLIDDKALVGNNLHYLVDPATYKTAKSTTKATSDAGAGFLVDFENGVPRLNGFSVHVSTHVPANTLIFGNFSELLVGSWGAIALASDPFTDFSSGTVGVRAMMPIDLAVRHAVSFAKSTA
jgi:HK97 family phage major capsid protein